METMTLFLSVTAAAVFAVMLGRLVWGLLKTLLLLALVLLVLTQVNFKRTPLCRAENRKSVPSTFVPLYDWACR